MLQGKIVSPTCDTSNAGYKTSFTPDTNQNKIDEKRNLSQVRLEEYNMQTAALDDQQTAQLFVHQKQSSYAQSEGYYSYVSSSDSSSTTPFLERLRQETDSPFNQYIHPPRNDFVATPTSILEKLKDSENNVTSLHPQNNNWEISSSTETLKWLGSVNDVYNKNVAGVNGSDSVPNPQLIVRSSRVMAPKRHHSESVLCTTNTDRYSMSTIGSTDSSVEQLLESTQEEELVRNSSPLISSSRTEIIESIYKDDGSQKLNVSIEIQNNSTIATISPKSIASSESKLSTCESVGDDIGSLKTSPFSDISKNSFSTKGLPLKSESSPSLNSTEMFYRSNNRLFPLNTYSEMSQSNNLSTVITPTRQEEELVAFQKVHPPKETNNLPSSMERVPKKPSNWQTVAELINDFESTSHNQQNQKFAYLEPSKIHRVSNSSLKVLQKSAVQSYIERQKQQQIERKERSVNKRLLEQPPNAIHSLQRSELTRSVRHGDAQRSSLPNVNSSNWPQPTAARMYGSTSSQNVYKISPSGMPKEKSSNPLIDSALPPPPPPRIRLNRRSSSASDCRIVENVSPSEKSSFNDSGMPSLPPPPPPPRNRIPVTSLSAMPDNMILKQLLISKNLNSMQQTNLSNNLEKSSWAPERPPKKPSMRLPSPELPPPPPSETEINYDDEPLPPPPPEIMQSQVSPSENYTKNSLPTRRNSFTTPNLQKQYTATPVYASNEVMGSVKVPPSIPKKPTSIQKLNNFQNASNNRKRPHYSMQASLPATHSPSPVADLWKSSTEKLISHEHNFNQLLNKPSPSPPPLAPKTFNTKTKTPVINKNSRCNSKASYLTIQPSENDKSYNLDHGSYKLTNTVHEDDFSINPKYTTSTDLKSYSKNENIPCNLPDVLPVGALHNQTQTTSFKILEQKGPEKMNANIEYRTQPEKLTFLTKEKDRHSISVLDRDNNKILNDPQGFSRSQSYDAGAERQAFSLDLNRIGEHLNNNINTNSLKDFEEHQNKTQQPINRDYIRTNKESNRSFDETLSSRSQQLKEEHIAHCLIPALKRQSISRQQSLRENIEKITQLQSQLMSTHLTSNTILRPLSEELAPCLPITIETSTRKEESKEEKEEQELKEEFKERKEIESPLFIEQKESLKTLNDEDIKQESPKVPEDSKIEGLKLIQRSEIVLRVGSLNTVETACQTDDLADLMETNSCSKEDTLSTKSNNSSDEQETENIFENLTNELADLLSPENHLLCILKRLDEKTSKDYIGALYNPEISNRSNKKHVGTLTLLRRKSRESPDRDTTSDFKTKENEVLETKTDSNNDNLLAKKLEELIQHLSGKMKVLNSEQSSIQEQSASNEVLGNDLLNKMSDKMRPSETTRVRTYIDDVGHITSLLLSLSERLAKIDNSLNKNDDKNGDKIHLERKREMLQDQLEEASRLKNDIVRRGENITNLLEKNLTNEEIDDYNYFINMKAKLIVDTRDITGKIILNEEQLNALKEALTASR